MLHSSRLLTAYRQARQTLLDERLGDHWVGSLSTSALSTATAVSALALVDRHQGLEGEPHRALLEGGIRWLAEHQNPDGGWGDTDKSYSNIATTMLARAAFDLSGTASGHAGIVDRGEQYLAAQGGVAGVRRRYGRDKTFAVPILANAALAGLVPWREVSPLPFELACFPQSVYRFLRLPVVSYAIPALVAIGHARYFHLAPKNPWTRGVRAALVPRSLRVLERMQPDSGGYLEAVPLTSFVVMCLASTGQANHAVTRQGVQFIEASVRPDGSWPIDTNLATWNTTLALNALAAAGEDIRQFACLDWLLSCQHREVHPFTAAQPGGWGWSDLSGAVPDADDTPGALLALATWSQQAPAQDGMQARIQEAAEQGVQWLLRLQNRDGGWPTFCRGWGKLPFDRSGADLTAHALRALHAWRHLDGGPAGKRIARGIRYLNRTQRADGSWVPLWFGNQDHPDEDNPVYGTSKVLLAVNVLQHGASQAARRGIRWLEGAQNGDGGWGGGPAREQRWGVGRSSSVEETAVALEALCAIASPSSQPAVNKGLEWLVTAVDEGRHRETSPIGFYFAKLWYYERLYPITFTVSALGTALRRSRDGSEREPTPA